MKSLAMKTPAAAAPKGVFRLGFFFCLLSAATYGMNPVLAKLGYSVGLAGIDILHARFLFATVILAFAGPFLEKGFYRFSKDLLKRAGIIAALILIPLNLLYVYALKDIPASMMSLITYVYPLVVLTVNCVFLGKKAVGRQLLSVGFILLGCLCIFSDALSLKVAPFALVLGFASTVMYALYLISLQQFAAKVSALQITFLTIAFSTAGLCFVHNPAAVFGFSSGQLAVTFAYGLVSTVMSTIFLSRAIQLLGATEAGIFCSFEPVFTIVFAALLLGESVPAFRWLGMALLLLGIIVPNAQAIRRALNRSCG